MALWHYKLAHELMTKGYELAASVGSDHCEWAAFVLKGQQTVAADLAYTENEAIERVLELANMLLKKEKGQ